MQKGRLWYETFWTRLTEIALVPAKVWRETLSTYAKTNWCGQEAGFCWGTCNAWDDLIHFLIFHMSSAQSCPGSQVSHSLRLTCSALSPCELPCHLPWGLSEVEMNASGCLWGELLGCPLQWELLFCISVHDSLLHLLPISASLPVQEKVLFLLWNKVKIKGSYVEKVLPWPVHVPFIHPRCTVGTHI